MRMHSPRIDHIPPRSESTFINREHALSGLWPEQRALAPGVCHESDRLHPQDLFISVFISIIFFITFFRKDARRLSAQYEIKVVKHEPAWFCSPPDRVDFPELRTKLSRQRRFSSREQVRCTFCQFFRAANKTSPTMEIPFPRADRGQFCQGFLEIFRLLTENRREQVAFVGARINGV